MQKIHDIILYQTMTMPKVHRMHDARKNKRQTAKAGGQVWETCVRRIKEKNSMGFNPIKMMQARSAMAQFEKRHPKVRGFLESVSADALQEGTVVEVSVTTPQGKNYITNIKVTREDIELFQDARRISRGRQQERDL